MREMKLLRTILRTHFGLHRLKSEKHRDFESRKLPPSPSFKARPRPHQSSRSRPSTLPPYPLSTWHHRATSVVPTRCWWWHRPGNKFTKAPSLWLCRSRFNFLPASLQKCCVASLFPRYVTSCSLLSESQHSHSITADPNRQETAV